jgi:hypothetical protein
MEDSAVEALDRGVGERAGMRMWVSPLATTAVVKAEALYSGLLNLAEQGFDPDAVAPVVAQRSRSRKRTEAIATRAPTTTATKASG